MNREELSERFLRFAVDVIQFLEKAKHGFAIGQISSQLMRSATSAGANYQEACGGESKADFVHKLQLSLKELRESLYWLKLLNRLNYGNINKLLSECDELISIMVKSVVTIKNANISKAKKS